MRERGSAEGQFLLQRKDGGTVWAAVRASRIANDRFLAVLTDITERVREKLAAMLGLADSAIGAVQRIATELRPVVLDTLGLAAAIEWQTREFAVRSGIPCRVKVPAPDLRLASETATAMFRILQESLTNVARHAAATRVEVRLHLGRREVLLVVRDNGRGVPTGQLSNPFAVGLAGMRERALIMGGHLNIRSRPGRGTTVTLRVPRGRVVAGGGTAGDPALSEVRSGPASPGVQP